MKINGQLFFLRALWINTQILRALGREREGGRGRFSIFHLLLTGYIIAVRSWFTSLHIPNSKNISAWLMEKSVTIFIHSSHRNRISGITKKIYSDYTTWPRLMNAVSVSGDINNTYGYSLCVCACVYVGCVTAHRTLNAQWIFELISCRKIYLPCGCHTGSEFRHRAFSTQWKSTFSVPYYLSILSVFPILTHDLSKISVKHLFDGHVFGASSVHWSYVFDSFYESHRRTHTHTQWTCVTQVELILLESIRFLHLI